MDQCDNSITYKYDIIFLIMRVLYTWLTHELDTMFPYMEREHIAAHVNKSIDVGLGNTYYITFITMN